MKPCEIWIEQCEATRQIEAEFGTQNALDYLIGEKFLNFLQAAETDAEFRAEIPAFVVLKLRFLTPPDQIAARYSLGCDCRSCLASTLRPVGVSIFSASSFSSRCSASCRTARANP